MDKFIAHILVVDDDDGIRSLVKKYLNENKFLVTTAESAENALEKIKIIKFDLIVLDIMMPGKSGLDFIKENKNKLENAWCHQNNDQKFFNIEFFLTYICFRGHSSPKLPFPHSVEPF